MPKEIKIEGRKEEREGRKEKKRKAGREGGREGGPKTSFGQFVLSVVFQVNEEL